MANIVTNYMGLTLKSPIVVASSGLTQSVSKIKEFADNGAGAIVLKSLFEEQIKYEVTHTLGKDPHNSSYPEAEDYILNYTRQHSVQNYINLIKEAKAAVDIPVIASINCVSSKEWTSFAKEVEQAGADAIELNVFIVPTSTSRESKEIEDLYVSILDEVKSIVSIPVSMKLGFYFTNMVRFTERLQGHGVNALTLFNRFYEPDIDVENLEMTACEIFSASSDIRRSLRWVGILSGCHKNLEIAASTGIHDGEALVKQILAGAQVGQVCSTLYINGAEKLKEMNEYLSNFMDKWSFNSLEEFRGRLNYKTIPDTEMYERAQFMRFFGSKKDLH